MFYHVRQSRPGDNLDKYTFSFNITAHCDTVLMCSPVSVLGDPVIIAPTTPL